MMGIIQSTPDMLRLLAGETVLWMPIKPQPYHNEFGALAWKTSGAFANCGRTAEEMIAHHAPIQPGDMVFVRETWCIADHEGEGANVGLAIAYRADDHGVELGEAHWFTVGIDAARPYVRKGSDPREYFEFADSWRSPITMPCWASRISRTVAAVGVEQRNGLWGWRIET